MNNTKWREVWTIIAARSLRVQIRFAHDERWNSANAEALFGPFCADIVAQDHIRDPGIGGPFYYREIQTLRILDSSPETIRQLRALGQLPTALGNGFIDIAGST